MFTHVSKKKLGHIPGGPIESGLCSAVELCMLATDVDHRNWLLDLVITFDFVKKKKKSCLRTVMNNF